MPLPVNAAVTPLKACRWPVSMWWQCFFCAVCACVCGGVCVGGCGWVWVCVGGGVTTSKAMHLVGFLGALGGGSCNTSCVVQGGCRLAVAAVWQHLGASLHCGSSDVFLGRWLFTVTLQDPLHAQHNFHQAVEPAHSSLPLTVCWSTANNLAGSSLCPTPSASSHSGPVVCSLVMCCRA